MTKSACTPPSAVPSGFFTSSCFAHRPLAVTNDGRALCAPKAVATATCGFTAGLRATGCWLGHGIPHGHRGIQSVA